MSRKNYCLFYYKLSYFLIKMLRKYLFVIKIFSLHIGKTRAEFIIFVKRNKL